MTSGAQTGIVPTNLPSFPWLAGSKLDATPLNNVLFELFNLIQNQQGQLNALATSTQESNLGVGMTLNWGGGTTITEGTYVLMASAPYDFTITSIDVNVGITGGSFKATVVNNFQNVLGLSNVLVTGPAKVNITALGGNEVRPGNELDVIITNVVGTPTDSYVCINGTTNAVPQQVIGVMTGHATGVSSAFAPVASTLPGQLIGFAAGKSQVSGAAAASVVIQGFAIGGSSATGQIVFLTPPGTLAMAVGTSSAVGFITGTSASHIFVMDDPMFGALDVNPID